MEQSRILSAVDHTLLSPTATPAQIRRICEEGLRYHTASVCIPAVYVREAAAYTDGQIPIGTVIGFPNGYSTTAAKCFEAADAVKNGAAEIDMVIQLGWLKDRRYGDLLNEIRAVKDACDGRLLKVIVETCLLTGEEKIAMCDVVSRSGADFIKTSTGFSAAGAVREDIALMKRYVAPGIGIKAAGGIASWEDARDFLALGATRLGTSRLVALAAAADADERESAPGGQTF